MGELSELLAVFFGMSIGAVWLLIFDRFVLRNREKYVMKDWDYTSLVRTVESLNRRSRLKNPDTLGGNRIFIEDAVEELLNKRSKVK